MFGSKISLSGSASVGLVTVVATVAMAGLLLSGCGETVIDNQKADGAIQTSLEKSLHEKITSVECPSNQKVEAGKTFSCEVNFSQGKKAIATLKILNKEADVSLVGLKPSK
jgi:PBP1b-binding outer membrane lipoprotein LpoB